MKVLVVIVAVVCRMVAGPPKPKPEPVVVERDYHDYEFDGYNEIGAMG